MPDYGVSIYPSQFLYSADIIFTNTTGDYKENLIVKLVLNEQNFNFDLINADFSDFRLLQNGSTLRMWLAYWSYYKKRCVAFFKLQNIAKDETTVLNAYWGNEDTILYSEPEEMGFLFYENFYSTPLSSSKWSGDISQALLDDYGFLLTDNTVINRYITSITNPLLGKENWITEAGFYCDWTYTTYQTERAACMLEFVGTEGNFIVRFNGISTTDHTATSPTGADTVTTQTYGGFEDDSYNDVAISYTQDTDSVNINIYNRNTYGDINIIGSRKIEGDTRIKNIRVRGREYYSDRGGAYPSYVNWVVVREYDGHNLELDASNLYIDYEIIKPYFQDYKEYGSNIILPIYEVISSFGGNPYLLIDSSHDLYSNSWVSDEAAIDESYISLTFNTAWTADITDRKYKHYDSGHVYYYNASKLSDNDNEFMERNYFESLSSSGWACIKFEFPTVINSFRIKAHIDLSGCPKTYEFYGSNYNPNLYFNKAVLLSEGSFSQTTSWQARLFLNYESYKYYILKINDTYGGSNIKIQEWQMFQSLGDQRKKVITQLRLTPSLFSDYQSGFPKEISILGSDDTFNWDTILPWTSTYTPFISHVATYGYEQRYSFNNTKGYWSFRVLLRGNWGKADGSIIIGELGLFELVEESRTLRILEGTINEIQQITAMIDSNISGSKGKIFAANDVLNVFKGDKLVKYVELPLIYNDILSV